MLIEPKCFSNHSIWLTNSASHQSLRSTLWRQSVSLSPFCRQEAEAWRGEGTCPRSPSSQADHRTVIVELVELYQLPGCCACRGEQSISIVAINIFLSCG